MAKLCTLSTLLICLIINNSCTKHGVSSTFQRIDTVRYQAILNDSTNDWCVTGVYPVAIGTDTTFIATNEFSECGETKNVDQTFFIKKYTHNNIYLGIYGYNQWPNNPPFADWPVTINIYVNGNLVATQTARIKDSIKYIIY